MFRIFPFIYLPMKGYYVTTRRRVDIYEHNRECAWI